MEDNNIKNLSWLRDGCNWLVTLTSAIIVTSATFYTDIFGETPKPITVCIMEVVWIFFLFSIISGVICYFSTFKMFINNDYKLKDNQWVKKSYSGMLCFFIFGMIFFCFIILYNKVH